MLLDNQSGSEILEPGGRQKSGVRLGNERSGGDGRWGRTGRGRAICAALAGRGVEGRQAWLWLWLAVYVWTVRYVPRPRDGARTAYGVEGGRKERALVVGGGVRGREKERKRTGEI